MIHFFPRFAKDAADQPYGQSLRETGAPLRIFGSYIRQNYRHRYQLLLLGYPRLAWAAFRMAVKSLVLSGADRPGAVVISSDVEALVFAIVRAWPWAAKPQIVLMPFIFTSRASSQINRLRLFYYRFVMRCVAIAVCHSRLEIGRYEQMFTGCGTTFIFVPWGTFVPSPETILAEAGPLPPPGPKLAVAAGKSGRDYPTLVQAAAQSGCRLAIVCNDVTALRGVVAGDDVEILDQCFGMAYYRQLLRADVVVVPLQVEDISAGQMVMIQAMALAKPLIVTASPTVGDYMTDGTEGLLVPRGDSAALATALSRLMHDTALAARLAAAAQARYARDYSGNAHARLLVQALTAQLVHDTNPL